MAHKKTREWVLELIKKGELFVTWRETGIPGTLAAEATLPHFPMPVGTVHYRIVGNATIEILQSFVPASLRRCGIRSIMQEKLISWYPKCNIVISGTGTKDGISWMEANGYKKASNGDWVHRIKR